MYGLVNRAIQGLVEKQFGADAWERISTSAAAPKEGFASMESYDDALTYGLVGAASEELNLDPEAILEAFGEYWIMYTAEEGYGAMLSMMGSSLTEFLDNLDDMHERIQETMPALVPPSFEREDNGDGTWTLHYRSEREGLSPMVVGLLKGLAKRLGTVVEVEQLPPDEAGHCRFLVKELSV